MRAILRLACLVSLAVTTGSEHRAYAQAPPEADPALDEARIHNARAQELYGAGDVDGALREFELSYQLSASPTVLYNAAFVCEELGRAEEALIYYEEYLHYEEHAAGGQVPSKRDAAREAVARLGSRLEPTATRLSVETDDSDALAHVVGPDGRDQPVGLVPNVWYLPFGEYEVTVAAADGRAARQRVVLARDNPLDVRLSLAVTPDATAPQAPNLGTWGWATLGGGAAIALTGVVVIAVGDADVTDANDLQADPTLETPQDFAARQSSRRSEGESEQLAGYVLTGVGAAGAVTGAVLLALDLTGSEDATAAVLPMVGGASVGSSVRF